MTVYMTLSLKGDRRFLCIHLSVSYSHVIGDETAYNVQIMDAKCAVVK